MAPLPFIIQVFFVLHHAYSPHASTHFVGNCHLLSWKNQAMRPKRMHCWCVWIGMVHWKPPNIVVMSHLERHHGVGMRGLATAAPNKKKTQLKTWSEVVCVFDGLYWCFFLISPVALTSVDHKGRSKSIAFLLVFSCPIDKDFLIQFLIVQQVLKTNP